MILWLNLEKSQSSRVTIIHLTSYLLCCRLVKYLVTPTFVPRNSVEKLILRNSAHFANVSENDKKVEG